MLSRSVGRCIVNAFRNRRLFHQSIRCMGKDDAIQSYFPDTKNANDPMERIKHCTTSYEFFNVISKVGNLSADETMASLRRLFELQKDTRTSIDEKEIVAASEFEKLCRSLKRNARHMELNDVIDALKIVSFVGLKSNSEIVMSLLNLIKYQINDVSLGRIVFLDYLLEQMESNPSVDALKMALPTILQIQISTKLDHENIAEVVDLLRYVSSRRVSDPCIMNICAALRLRAEDLNADQARYVIWSLSSSNLRVPKAYLDNILTDAIASLCRENIGERNVSAMITTLAKMTKKYANDPREFDKFYNEKFFNHCADSIVNNDLGFENALFALYALNTLSFVHLKLLKYILQKIDKYPRLITETGANHFLTFVHSLSYANFKPQNWDKIESLILRSNILTTEKRSNLPWIKLSLELLALGIETPSIWDRIFDNQFLKLCLAPLAPNKRDRTLRFLELYQAVALTGYNVEGRIDEKFLDEAKEILQSVVQCPMQQYLEVAFGGPSFVCTKVRTRYGQIIDHVIAFDKVTMEPAPINSDRSKIDVHYEDIATDDSKQYIAVLSFPATSYCINIPILKASCELKLQTYEKMGITAVSINQAMWNDMPDVEKIPYIQQEVKLKAAQVQNILQ